jgi:hypothetical protein
MALRELPEAFREADGLLQQPPTRAGIFGFLAAKASTPQARSVC